MSTLSQFFSSGSGSGYADSNFTLFTSSGSLTIPTAVKYVAMAVMGGAGAQGYSSPTQIISGGGGGFSYWDGPVTSTGGSLTVTVGAGGTWAPTNTPNAGANGGTSSIPNATTILPGSANISATGGGTAFLVTSPSTFNPAAGGTGSNGIINSSGGTGGVGPGKGAGGVFGPAGLLGGYSGSGGDRGRTGLAAENGKTAGGVGAAIYPASAAGQVFYAYGNLDGSQPGAPGYIISTTRNGRISQTKTFFAAAGGAGGDGWVSAYTVPGPTIPSPQPQIVVLTGEAGHGGAGGAGGAGAYTPSPTNPLGADGVPGGNGGFGAGGGAGGLPIGAGSPISVGGAGGFGGSAGSTGTTGAGSGIASVEWWNY